MSDTKTALNPGVGGDNMDEELVTQDDDSTAKAPRVLLRGRGKGAIVDTFNVEPAVSPYSVPALAIALVDDAPAGGYVRGELRALSATTEGRLRVSSVSAAIDPDYFGGEQPTFFASSPLYSGNPWSNL